MKERIQYVQTRIQELADVNGSNRCIASLYPDSMADLNPLPDQLSRIEALPN